MNTHATTPPYKWYRDHRFSLLPTLEIRQPVAPRNEWDSGTPKGFSFKWLFIRMWSLKSAYLELSLVADTHWGIGIIGILPYLRWTLCVPMPPAIGERWYKLTQRKP